MRACPPVSLPRSRAARARARARRGPRRLLVGVVVFIRLAPPRRPPGPRLRRCRPAARDRAAPHFTLRDQAGDPVSLAALPRQVVVLVAFLYSTCGAPCARDRPADPRRARRTGRSRVPRAAVSAPIPRADTPARVRRFLARVSLSGRVAVSERPARAAAAGLARVPRAPRERTARRLRRAPPSVFLIDRAGTRAGDLPARTAHARRRSRTTCASCSPTRSAGGRLIP